MGKIGKHVFKHYAESECPRQLFLDVATGDPAWISPYRDLVEDPHRRVSGKTLADLGHAYEQTVYAMLLRSPSTRASEALQSGRVIESSLDPATLAAYGDELRAAPAQSSLLLLEHAWETPASFVRHLFDLPESAPLPISVAPGPLRPDIIVLRRADSEASEVLPDGSTRVVPAAERASRLALELIDIKHTHEQAVGKTHLIELLYYGIAMSAMLRDSGLTDRFFVSVTGHAILPRRDAIELSELRSGGFVGLTVPLAWHDMVHLFEGARRALIALLRASPTAIERVPAHVQAACGRCAYASDCVESLKGGSADPAAWDVSLLPFLRQGTAEQLRGLGLTTVGDVAKHVRDLPKRGGALPVYAEVPALELKARALVAKQHLPASPENTAGETLLSIALPRYSDVELVFDFETDPTNEVVFAFGLLFTVSPSPNAGYADVHARWWTFWQAALAAKSKPDYAALDAMLDPDARATGARGDAARHALFADFKRSLEVLRDASGSVLEIAPRPPVESEEAVEGGEGPLRMSYRYAYINGGSRTGGGHHDGERALAERCVELLCAIFVVSVVYETFVARAMHEVDAKGQPRVWFQRPNFAAYYWSREQLENVQDLLERHVGALATGPLREHFLALMGWVSPSGSGITSDLQHRKVFNLREFVETSVGHPEIINLTWHGVDVALDASKQRAYSRRFWAPHFNYMDFAAWHEYLEEPDANRQRELFDRLGREVTRKLWALQRILRRTRAMVPEGISRARRSPVSSLELPRIHVERDRVKSHLALPVDHALATMWVLYNQINGAMQELDAEYSRTTWPLQSIAKLEAAEVSDLAVDGLTNVITFTVGGLSVNVKVAEGDQMLLMPESRRDGRDASVESCIVAVNSMRWNAATRRYDFEVGLTWKSAKHPILDGVKGAERWFLYPHASDPWLKPLINVLDRRGIATSWLGHRLAYLWRVGFDATLAPPKVSTFNASEVYLFAPTHLPTGRIPDTEKLLTTAHFPPDPSQEEALRVALGSTITCIQGPPGTGKSQTIVALIDEFMCRRGDRSARVLVTAFSYAALRVVLDKVRESRDKHGDPTLVARSKLIWNRSQGRDPIDDEPGKPHVIDLVVENGKKAIVEGDTFERGRGKNTRRLDAVFGERFVMFANAYSLVKMGTESESKAYEYELLPNGFGFDLIVIDEASQVPASQLLAGLALVCPATFTLGNAPSDTACEKGDAKALRAITLSTSEPADALTKVVIVGDDNQLPPVQAIEPPEKLRIALDSAFRYYVDAKAHGVVHRQLRTNYRSKPTLVEYTRSLGIYKDGLEAFRAKVPYAPLPAVPTGAASWVRAVLDDAVDVSTLIHATQHETATSPLEATIAAQLCIAFLDQMAVHDDARERRFWAEDIGIVAPHNAQGRLVTRAIYDGLTRPGARRTSLGDEALMQALRATIYSVEKFQGSDRTLILGTVAISSRDQLAAEEAFIYDLNRFNVLTSRAKQKMVLICSRAFLDYVPNEREVFAHAARVRDFAYGFCDREETFTVAANNAAVPITWRYRA